jgi:hypothetical protein
VKYYAKENTKVGTHSLAHPASGDRFDTSCEDVRGAF